MIVTEDPDVLLKDSMQQAVQYSLKDVSTMVREAAVDLIGKYYMHIFIVNEIRIHEIFVDVMGEKLFHFLEVRKFSWKVTLNTSCIFDEFSKFSATTLKNIQNMPKI